MKWQAGITTLRQPAWISWGAWELFQMTLGTASNYFQAQCLNIPNCNIK